MKTRNKFLILNAIAIFSFFLFSACGQINAKDTLNETSWLLTAIDDTPTLEGTKVTVEFSDGQIGGSSGCNSYGGSYETKGEKITTSSIIMTMMACVEPSVMEQEQTFLQYLQDAQTFQISGKQLQIFNSNGKALIFIQE